MERPMTSTALDKITAALAAPKTHAVVSTYADGRAKWHETRCANSAETFAIGERRKIGRELIDRATGDAVRVVSVDIEPLTA